MIIPIMGNHGSGKSTLVSKIADVYESVNLVTDGRKQTRQPVIMECSSADHLGVAVIGYYQMGQYSGLDSGRFAGRMDEIFGWMEAYASDGWHVLAEGMLVCSMWNRFVDLKMHGHDVTVVCLDTSVEECAISVAHRKTTSTRRHKYSDSPVNYRSLESKERGILNAYSKLIEFNVPLILANRHQAELSIRKLLGLDQ